jgi:NitT/TauT family transport system ATP-binding protein
MSQAAGMPERAALVGIADVARWFEGPGGKRVDALGPVTFDLAAGAFVAVVGPSGCGKSTLLRLIAGLDAPSAGAIRRDGVPITSPSRDVGIVFQDHVLLPWLTVLDNVLLPAELFELPKDAARARARQLIDSVGLLGFERHKPVQLSGGMRQRAAICRALLAEPSILLFDEPFGALDALTRERLSLDLAALWGDSARTALLITHDIAEAVLLADEVIVMTPGPGRIRERVAVDLPRPRTAATRRDPRFVGIAENIRDLIFADWHEAA